MSHTEILIKHAVVAAGKGNIRIALVQGVKLACFIVVVERVRTNFAHVHANQHIVAGSVVLALLSAVEKFVENAAQCINLVDGVFLGNLLVLLKLSHVLRRAFGLAVNFAAFANAVIQVVVAIPTSRGVQRRH